MHTSTKKICIILGILLVLGCVGIWGIYSMIHSFSIRSAEREAEVQQKNLQAQNDRSLKMFVSDSSADVARLSGRILEKQGAVSFIETIEKYGRDHAMSISIDSISEVEAVENKELFEQLDVTLSSKGPWKSTYQFLVSLENLPYKVTLSKVALIQDPFAEVATASTTSVWNGSYTISVLKYK